MDLQNQSMAQQVPSEEEVFNSSALKSKRPKSRRSSTEYHKKVRKSKRARKPIRIGLLRNTFKNCIRKHNSEECYAQARNEICIKRLKGRKYLRHETNSINKYYKAPIGAGESSSMDKDDLGAANADLSATSVDGSNTILQPFECNISPVVKESKTHANNNAC